MASIHLVANEVLFTSYGHLQLVFDQDSSFDNGGETELEVQGPFLAIGDWDVRPLQAYSTPFGADTQSIELAIPTNLDAADVWDVLVNARDMFATQSIDYRLGLLGSLEGQNSNSYITTLSHIVGLDISGAVATILSTPEFSSLPGLARNVLFDHVASDDSSLSPIALDMEGSNGADTLFGGNGADILNSLKGSDRVTTYAGDDTVRGGNGRDKVFGGDDNDTLYGDAGDDRLFGEDGDDILDGGTKSDRLFGGDGNDMLIGGQGVDTLFGNVGTDTLLGGRGKDLLKGGNGADILSGQGGADTMTGGRDADVFVFDGTIYEGRDTITDFTLQEDLIRVAGLTFSDLTITGTTSAVITLDGNTKLTLTGVAAADIGQSDFDFV